MNIKRFISSKWLVWPVCVALWGTAAAQTSAHPKPESHPKVLDRDDYMEGRKERPAIMTGMMKEAVSPTAKHMSLGNCIIGTMLVNSEYALVQVQKDVQQPLMYVLMRKQNNQWKFLTMGSSLKGSGKKYSLPRNLWSKWNL